MAGWQPGMNFVYGEHYEPMRGETPFDPQNNEEYLPYYRFLKRTAKGVTLCGAGEKAGGISAPNQERFLPETEAGKLIRKGWMPNEQVSTAAMGSGDFFIELGVGGGEKGNEVKSDANGKGIVYTKPTITAAGATAAETESVRDAPYIKNGRLLKGGVAGDIVPIDMAGY